MPGAEPERVDPPPNPVPFVAAVAIFAVLLVLAVVFLRDDEPGRLVAPDGISVVDADQVLLRWDDPTTGLARITQVGYAIDDEQVRVELVVVEDDCGDVDCGGVPDSVEAVLVLPEPVGDRQVRAGTGRTLADCDEVTDDGLPLCR